MPDRSPTIENPWQHLRQLTPARIALGRAGTSLPTGAQLDFQFAHAQARDAVHLQLDSEALMYELKKHQLDCVRLHSAAADRQVYLQRPDLGRRLDETSVALLDERTGASCALAVVIADGLSALAVQRHALPMTLKIAEHCRTEGWSLGPIAVVEQGRVAVADEIGQRLNARMVVILLGERPGLSSPDSLGLYFTWAPQVGRHDAQRNCISNIRPEGLAYNLAAHRLLYLMREACRRRLSGVQLKDEAEVPTLDGEPRAGNFLLG